jgi:hypothetical protein
MAAVFFLQPQHPFWLFEGTQQKKKKQKKHSLEIDAYFSFLCVYCCRIYFFLYFFLFSKKPVLLLYLTFVLVPGHG